MLQRVMGSIWGKKRGGASLLGCPLGERVSERKAQAPLDFYIASQALRYVFT